MWRVPAGPRGFDGVRAAALLVQLACTWLVCSYLVVWAGLVEESTELWVEVGRRESQTSDAGPDGHDCRSMFSARDLVLWQDALAPTCHGAARTPS